MLAKGEYLKIKGSLCNSPIEIANICNVSPRPVVSNGFIFFKFKQDLIKFRSHVYFVPVGRHMLYQVLPYLK